MVGGELHAAHSAIAADPGRMVDGEVGRRGTMQGMAVKGPGGVQQAADA